ncbi:hypothetical protein B0H14DRAFT_3782792 [Mycena olivaceomarginata]|nr:hypothetical protein B0H14DRAFT_3782792 [Mycena olivaceomarginata]
MRKKNDDIEVDDAPTSGSGLRGEADEFSMNEDDIGAALASISPEVWWPIDVCIMSQSTGTGVPATASRGANHHSLGTGTVGITGNERADGEARQAAQDQDSSNQRDIPPSLHGVLPWSRSAVRQSLNAARKTDYEKVWKGSARCTRTIQYDAHLLKGSYIDLADTLPRSYARVAVGEVERMGSLPNLTVVWFSRDDLIVFPEDLTLQ